VPARPASAVKELTPRPRLLKSTHGAPPARDQRVVARDSAAASLWHDVEIRRVIRSTNTIESINARYRRAIRARGHFPTEQAALKCLYLVTRSLDPTGRGKTIWAMRWKPALNALAITFNGRFPRAETC
jgi:hypothetical protein